jgi:hypothetical protein
MILPRNQVLVKNEKRNVGACMYVPESKERERR